MLNYIRKISSGIVVRVFLGIIVFTFVAWGIRDVMQFQNDPDIVKFKDAENITQTEFLQAKSNVISQLQRQHSKNFTQEELNALNVDAIVLQNLINKSLLQYLNDFYDMNMSEELVISFIKQSSDFKNEKGEFDSNIFKMILRNSYQSEAEYIENVKNSIMSNSLINILVEGIFVPKVMINNFAAYLAENRVVDLFSIDFDNQYSIKDFLPEASDQELLDFYNSHQDIFITPEERSILYTKISNDLIKKKVRITDDEVLSFYNEYKDEFGNKPFAKVAAEVKNKLISQKLDEAKFALSKELEDQVAEGLKLEEISKKYGSKVISADVSKNKQIDQLFKQEGILDSIFEMIESEVSYPIDLQNDGGLLLVEISSIKPSKLQEFKDVIENVKALWLNAKAKKVNVAILQDMCDLYQKYRDLGKYSDLVRITRNVNITQDKYSESVLQKSLPAEFISTIFDSKIGSSTQVFSANNMAYFAHVKSRVSDEQKVSTIISKQKQDIQNSLKNAILEEMFNYIKAQQKIQIKQLSS